jgi:hypothetical protein
MTMQGGRQSSSSADPPLEKTGGNRGTSGKTVSEQDTGGHHERALLRAVVLATAFAVRRRHLGPGVARLGVSA